MVEAIEKQPSSVAEAKAAGLLQRLPVVLNADGYEKLAYLGWSRGEVNRAVDALVESGRAVLVVREGGAVVVRQEQE